MKILITGGAGFIGSHVADAYLQQGHEVVIVDNLSTGYLDNVNTQAKFYQIDICSSELNKVFSTEKPDIVNHHAAQISIPVSVKDPLADAEINVKGFINLMQCCTKYQVRKVIFISSGGAIYGEAAEYPTSESCPTQPLSPYAINKKVSEDYLYYYRKAFCIDYTILRYSNVYGPRQVSHGEAGVVSIFMEKLLAGERPNLYAYNTEPDGMIRDYLYVKDAVLANLAALDKGSGEAYNIATCTETRTLALFNEIAGQMHSEIQPVLCPARKGDIHRSLLNIDKAFKQLRWQPHYTLKEGIAETIKFFTDKTQR